MKPNRVVPVPLRREIDVDRICREDPRESVLLLGSFWPNSRNSFESHVVKGFKECCPTADFQPYIGRLCEFYADLILGAVQDWSFEWVVHVLSSSEVEPDPVRPQSLLTDVICLKTGAQTATHLFFKSTSRPSMRSVPHLSGPEALKSRIKYVIQDLFINPKLLGGNVLLIDDIYNTGASTWVYASALKQYAGVGEVYTVNLAATRFNGGKDGHGMLRLDTGGFDAYPDLKCAYLDSECVYHSSEVCDRIQAPITCEMLFLAQRKGGACAACMQQARAARRWWQIR